MGRQPGRERLEAGLVLTGTEVKAARDGKIQLKESYGEVVGNEAWLVNAHIGQYSHGNIMNHEPIRRRKMLLHRKEIDKLLSQTREKGLTCNTNCVASWCDRLQIDFFDSL